MPGLIADRYGDTVVCQLTTAGADAWRDVLADALFALPGVACVYERSDADVREREGLPPVVGLLRGGAPSADLVAHEGGHQFAVEVEGGHKTGFYLDQRDARGAVAGWAAGRRVLCQYGPALLLPPCLTAKNGTYSASRPSAAVAVTRSME